MYFYLYDLGNQPQNKMRLQHKQKTEMWQRLKV